MKQQIIRVKRWVRAGLLLSVVLVFIMGSSAMAAPARQYVYDQAGLLQEGGQLEADIAQLRETVQADIVIVTTRDTSGKSARSYADDFYDEKNFGYDQPRGDGVLLLIDMEHREAYISTCGKAIAYFTDERIDQALDQVVEALGDGRYDKACQAFLTLAEEYLLHKPGESFSYGYRLKIMLSQHLMGALGGAVILAIVVTMSLARSAKMTKVHASRYLLPEDGYVVTARTDQYRDEFTTSRKIPRNNQGSGSGRSGGGSSTHTGSSGTRHGGGGRSF